MHGNPSLKTLVAIAKGFRQTPQEYEEAPLPTGLLLFSDPEADSPINDVPSNVTQLLASPYRPRPPLGFILPTYDIYNYRCFRLRRGGASTSAGRIIFGRNGDGWLSVQFSLAAVADAGAGGLLNDWVEMTP